MERENDGLPAARKVFDGIFAADPDGAAPGLVDLLQFFLGVQDLAGGREIRALDIFQQVLDIDVGVIDHGREPVDHLAEVVRREGAAHAHGDPRGAVHQKLGKARRQDHRLLQRVVVVRPEAHGVLVDLDQELFGDLREPRLGIPHGGCRVAVEAAEIARAVDERIAEREVLRHPDHGVVRGLVAVGMELAEHLADHGRALSEFRRGPQAHLPHGKEDPAVHGLEPVAHVGQRAGHNGRERIGEKAVLDLGMERGSQN